MSRHPDRNDTSDPSDDQPDPCPDKKGIRVRPFVGLALWALVAYLAFRYWAATRFVVLGGLASASLAALLRPLAERLPGRSELRAVLSVALLVVVAGGVLTGLGWALYDPIVSNVEQWPELRDQANAGLRDAASWLGVNGELSVDEVGQIALRIFIGESPGQWISDFAGSVITTIVSIVVIVIASIYLLARPPGSLSNPALELLPVERQEPTCRALEQVQPQLRWWVLGTLFSMTVVGVISGIGYWIIGLQFAFALALFAGVAQAVPTFGPMVTFLLSLLVAGTQGTQQLVGVIVVYLVVQSLESYILTPMVMMRAVRVPPVVTLFTIILWGNVFGLAGLLFAIPLDLVIWALLKHHLAAPHKQQEANSGSTD